MVKTSKPRRRKGLAPEEYRKVSIVEVPQLAGLGDAQRSVIETYRHGTNWRITIDQIDSAGESTRLVLSHAEAEVINRHRYQIIKEGRSMRSSDAAARRKGIEPQPEGGLNGTDQNH